MAAERARSCGYRAYGRQVPWGVDGVHRDAVRAAFAHRESAGWIHGHRTGIASCGYRAYGRQGPGGDVDGVHRDVVRVEIGHIGELAGRIHATDMDCSCGYRAMDVKPRW